MYLREFDFFSKKIKLIKSFPLIDKDFAKYEEIIIPLIFFFLENLIFCVK